jgi:hypothetical protein
VKSDSHNRPVSPPRRWTALLLALLFLVMASEQAVHSHRGSVPSSKQVDTLDSNSVAHCAVCLHSQAAPLGNIALLASPHATAEPAALPGLLEPHATGEEPVHRVRPPPAA